MPDHTLVALLRTTEPDRPLFGCACGEAASGIDGARWDIVDSPDGMTAVSISPSVNFPEHFHAFFTNVPYRSSAEFFGW